MAMFAAIFLAFASLTGASSNGNEFGGFTWDLPPPGVDDRDLGVDDRDLGVDDRDLGVDDREW